jgi:hypothetical protein
MRVRNYLLRRAQSIEATPPLRAVICSGGIPDPAFSRQEVTLLLRHVIDKALLSAAYELSLRHIRDNLASSCEVIPREQMKTG